MNHKGLLLLTAAMGLATGIAAPGIAAESGGGAGIVGLSSVGGLKLGATAEAVTEFAGRPDRVFPQTSYNGDQFDLYGYGCRGQSYLCQTVYAVARDGEGLVGFTTRSM